MRFYTALYAFVFFLYSPVAIYKIGFKNYWKRLFGWHPKENLSSKSVWIHAVSVGETVAVAPLAAKLFQEGYVVVVSNMTYTGHKEAKRSIGQAAYHFYLPFDFPWAVKKALKWVKPEIVVICETDLWYNFLKASQQIGAKVILVNGKVSHSSYRLYHRFSFYGRHLFKHIDRFLVQSDEYYDRFYALGVPEEKLKVTGNLKLDRPVESMDCTALRKKYIVPENAFLIVIGSTHEGEEEKILEQLLEVRKDPKVFILVVPRHPERFKKVASIIKGERIALVAQMGVLRECFAIADLAILGGSFLPGVGGHNVVEPAFSGTFVLFGPFMDTQKELVHLVKKYHTGEQLPLNCLGDRVEQLKEDPAHLDAFRANCQTLQKSLKGALERTWAGIFEK